MLCVAVSLLAGLPALVRAGPRDQRSETTKVRRTFVRSMRGHAQSESVVPWRGYALWVGGTLLVVFLAADALMPLPADQPLLQRARKNADDPNPFRGEGT